MLLLLDLLLLILLIGGLKELLLLLKIKDNVDLAGLLALLDLLKVLGKLKREALFHCLNKILLIVLNLKEIKDAMVV